MTKLDTLREQNPDLELFPDPDNIDLTTKKVVLLEEPVVQNERIEWATLEDLTEEDIHLRLTDLKRIAYQRRAYLFSQLSWRYERHSREVRLNLPTTDNLDDLDNYAQALADISKQPDYPYTITWPQELN